MFRCNEVAEKAGRLLDGELGRLDRLQLRLHLAMCRGCRAFLRQMRLTGDLARMARGTADGEMAPAIEAALARRRAASRRED